MNSMTVSPPSFTVAIAGFGTIGKLVAAQLDAGLPGLRLTAIAARDDVSARNYMERSFNKTYDIVDLEQLADCADIVIECCPAEHMRTIATPVLTAGKTLIAASVGAFVKANDLISLAEANGGRILVPSGALAGLDAVQAAAQGEIDSVRLITRKPPRGFTGSPVLAELGLSAEDITEPVCLFSGTATQAIASFPANANVAVALGLAGIGTDRTMVEIWADPAYERNNHTVEVISDSANLTITIDNLPSPSNPKTSAITALSVISALKRLTASVVIGA